MDRFKKFWQDHKDKVKGVVVGVGATSVVAYYLIVQTKHGRQITAFEVLVPYDSDTNTPGILFVRHKDKEEGTYEIIS